MIDPRHRWVLPEPIRLDPAFRSAASGHGLGPLAATVLARRGIADAEALGRFLGPAVHGLTDPWLLPDAGRLVDRVRAAVARRERVLVLGDFDADGLTGLAQLVLVLRRLGVEAIPYVPSRLDEGHGLSLAAVGAAAAAGATLIVTVDTGSTSVAEVAAAAARGIDVCITDHHQVPDRLPAAVALVNPHRHDARHPSPQLAGSGVAFTVARLLLGELAGAPEEALALADLATIGTVSDVAPLVGENRAIARLGLERIRTAPRPGIAALLAAARTDPAGADLATIGFVVAPRINAAGRVGDAIDAARLLLAEDPAEAAALAATLEAANATRRDLTRAAVAEARAALGRGADAETGSADADPAAVVVGAGPGDEAPLTLLHGAWPVGIVGLVAGRLADELGRPAIVGTRVGDTVRASCRGDGGLDLGRLLDAAGELLVRHGGHAAAAGFEVRLADWPRVVARLLELAGPGAAGRPDRPLPVDLVVPAAYVDHGLAADLARIGPCGAGNPEPLVAIVGLEVARVRQAGTEHASLVLRRERDVLDAIAFNRADLLAALAPGARVDVVATIGSRVHGGVEALRLEVRDVAASGSHARTAEVLAWGAGAAAGVGPAPSVGA